MIVIDSKDKYYFSDSHDQMSNPYSIFNLDFFERFMVSFIRLRPIPTITTLKKLFSNHTNSKIGSIIAMEKERTIKLL